MADTELSNPVSSAYAGAPNDSGSATSSPSEDTTTQASPAEATGLSAASEGGIDSDRGATADVAGDSGTRSEVDATDGAQAASEEPPKEFDLLTSDLPRDEILDLDGFYKGIKPEHLDKLDPLSKRVIHNLRRDYHNKRQKDSFAARELEAKYQDRGNQLKAKEREFVNRQKAFSELLDNPQLKSILSQPKDNLPDINTPEGLEARIERAAAEKLQSLINPVHEIAQRESKKAALTDFVAGHPEMRDKAFQKEMADVIRDRQKMGYSISTPDAYELVRSRRGAIAEDRTRKRDRQARAASARQIGRGKGNAKGTSGPPKGAKAHELYAWVKANPEEAKRLRSAGLKR